MKYLLIRLFYNIDAKIFREKWNWLTNTIYFSSWWDVNDMRGEKWIHNIFMKEFGRVLSANLDEYILSGDMYYQNQKRDEQTGIILNNILKHR